MSGSEKGLTRLVAREEKKRAQSRHSGTGASETPLEDTVGALVPCS